MRCIAIYSSVFIVSQKSYNELQYVIMGYKPLSGKHLDHQHISGFLLDADVLYGFQMRGLETISVPQRNGRGPDSILLDSCVCSVILRTIAE